MNYKGILIIFVILMGIGNALTVEVGVEKNFSGELKETSSISENGVIGYNIEFLNTGSLPYRACARLDLFENGKIIATSWSDYKNMNPGDRDYTNVYAFSDHPGTFDSRIRVYYANEIMEKWHRNVTIEKVNTDQGALNLTATTYGSRYIDFEIYSSREIKNVIISAESQLPGWILHERIVNLRPGSNAERIYYEQDVAKDNTIMIKAFGMDGKYYKSESIALSPRNDIIDGLENIVSGFIGFVGSFFQP